MNGIILACRAASKSDGVIEADFVGSGGMCAQSFSAFRLYAPSQARAEVNLRYP